MTVFARCRSGHWNAFVTRISLSAVPREYYYCGQVGCGLPFAEPIVFEGGATPQQMPIATILAKMPMYYRCAHGHENAEPAHRAAQLLGNLACGAPDCHAPLTRQRGSPPPAADTQLFVAAIAGVPATLFDCYSGHISYLNDWTQGNNYQNLACGHDNCFNPIWRHRARNTVQPVPERIPRARTFDFQAMLQRIAQSLQAVDKPYSLRSANFSGVVTLPMEQADFFSALCKLSIHRFDKSAKVSLTWNHRVYAELTAPSFMTYGQMHPYCYPVDPDTNQRRTQQVAYADIGTQLCQLTPDVVDMLLTVVLRVLRMKDSKQDDIAAIAAIEHSKAYIVGASPGRWNIMSLLSVLIGSAACETGRGVVGYVNVVAAFHHLKHDARQVWHGWATQQQHNPLGASLAAIRQVYSADYQLTGREPKRNSVGFMGSEGLIALHSGRAGSLSEDSSKHAGSYAAYVERDTALLARWRPREYPLLGARDQAHDGETPEQTFERKVTHYLRILFS